MSRRIIVLVSFQLAAQRSISVGTKVRILDQMVTLVALLSSYAATAAEYQAWQNRRAPAIRHSNSESNNEKKELVWAYILKDLVR